jgi:hypothetical protein
MRTGSSGLWSRGSSRGSGCRFAVALALAASLGIAQGSQAEPASLSNAELRILVQPFLPPAVEILIPATPLAPDVLDISRSGGGVTAIGFPAKVIKTTGFTLSITDPAFEPVDGVQITAVNPAADFTTMGGGENGFGGLMPLSGTLKVCLFGGAGCPGGASLELPMSLIGGLGTVVTQVLSSMGGVFATATVKGAAWTTGSTMLGTMASVTVKGGIQTTPGGVVNVNLVAPLSVVTDVGIEPLAWAVLSFEVPEPGVMALGLGAVAALAAMGLRRRRG